MEAFVFSSISPRARCWSTKMVEMGRSVLLIPTEAPIFETARELERKDWRWSTLRVLLDSYNAHGRPFSSTEPSFRLVSVSALRNELVSWTSVHFEVVVPKIVRFCLLHLVWCSQHGNFQNVAGNTFCAQYYTLDNRKLPTIKTLVNDKSHSLSTINQVKPDHKYWNAKGSWIPYHSAPFSGKYYTQQCKYDSETQ